jgi:hypothetical protein
MALVYLRKFCINVFISKARLGKIAAFKGFAYISAAGVEI